MFDIQKSIDLLRDGFFIDIKSMPNYQILTSLFKQDAYNYIMASSRLTEEDWHSIHKITSKWEKEGFRHSLYIEKSSKESFLKDIEKNKLSFSYDDLYVYQNVKKPINIPDQEYKFTYVDESNIEEFIDIANVCFPGWDNNTEFTRWCLESPFVEMIGLIVDSKIVAMGAYYTKENNDYILLMNDATLPEYRRRGLHAYITKLRINLALKKKPSAVFYANLEKGGGSFHSYTKLGFKEGCHYLVYN